MQRQQRALHRWVLILLGGASFLSVSASSVNRLELVSRGQLCVTEGTLEDAPGGGLAVNVPKMRAYVNA